MFNLKPEPENRQDGKTGFSILALILIFSFSFVCSLPGQESVIPYTPKGK
jgi:hypothetical protein